MSSEEKKIRVKRLRISADHLIIEPSRIIIMRPKKKKDEEEDEIFIFKDNFRNK